MSTLTAVAVTFRYPLEQDRKIPIEEVWTFVDSDNRLWDVARIIWQDGSWSYGKCWWLQEPLRMCRIGAGAYGDLLVLDREAELTSMGEVQ